MYNQPQKNTSPPSVVLKAIMRSSFRQDIVLVVFAVLSLLLHLLLLYLLPADRLMVAPADKQPVVVEVRSPQPRQREIDMPPEVLPPQPRQQPAKRQAPVDQVVPKETAPKGDAPEDRQPSPRAVARPSRPALEPRTPDGPGAVLPESLDLGLPETTRERLRGEARRKDRQDVEEGDVVWLDTEKDLLASFFKRFRDNIYQVWNYPRAAIERGESGVCLLKIVINQDGSVENAELLEGTGSPTLDREAVAAVYRGASYGNLPSSYPKEQLTIMAYFQYRLSSGVGSFDMSGR
jgi:protein TonB